MKTLKKLDVDKAAKAIEADAGQVLPGLRESLAEAKAGKYAQVHTPKHQDPAGCERASRVVRQ